MSGRQGWNLRKENRHLLPSVPPEKHSQWRGAEAGNESKRMRCRRWIQLAQLCERCGAQATDRHHKDADPGNNDPSNIAHLCRRCHMLADGRLQRLLERCKAPRLIKPPQRCTNCGHKEKPTRRGRCAACYNYLLRTGAERPPICPRGGCQECEGDTA